MHTQPARPSRLSSWNDVASGRGFHGNSSGSPQQPSQQPKSSELSKRDGSEEPLNCSILSFVNRIVSFLQPEPLRWIRAKNSNVQLQFSCCFDPRAEFSPGKFGNDDDRRRMFEHGMKGSKIFERGATGPQISQIANENDVQQSLPSVDLNPSLKT